MFNKLIETEKALKAGIARLLVPGGFSHIRWLRCLYGIPNGYRATFFNPGQNTKISMPKVIF